jgi:hypothetical protein
MYTRNSGHMLNEELLEIGSRLNLKVKDIESVKKAGTEEKLVRVFIHPISILIISFLTFIFGVSLGGGCSNCADYPYMRSGLAATTIPATSKKSLIYRLIIPALTFVAGFFVGRTFFSTAIMYNVYKR